MTDKLKEKLKEEAAWLPKEAQEVISSFNWEKTSEEIGKKYLLNESEINILQTEIVLILVGLIEGQYFAQNIENYVNTSKNEAIKISDEVNQKIFKPMMDKLNENIKKSMGIRNVHWQQNLDFILSGGDYTAFIKRIETPKREQEIPRSNTVFNKSKIDDLKSKFTI